MRSAEEQRVPTAQEMQLLFAKQIQLLRAGYIREVMAGKGPDAVALLKEAKPGDVPGTLYWDDIDYSNQNRSDWETREHLLRLLFALYQNEAEALEKDAAYRESALGVLRYWLAHRFTNPNWWHNDIGTPLLLADCSLQLWNYMTEEEKKVALEIISIGSLSHKPAIDCWTGANLLWGMMNTVRYALLTGDAALLARAAERTAQEIHIDVEGLQEDGAFCQHGPRWYSGGYGCNFTTDIAQLLYLFDGTCVSIPQEKVELFLRHVLDGQRMMCYRGFFDYSAVGREFARHGCLQKRNLHRCIELLAKIPELPRKDEVQAFAKECTESVSLVNKTRYYPSISLLCRHTPQAYFGVKCHNEGQYDEELCNGEGALAYNMSYGTRTCFMTRGDEYDNIDPIWDFAHVPGTLARLETDEELYLHRDWWCLPLPNGETGGAVDEDCGVIHERAEHDGISVQTAYFVCGNTLLALGADIRDTKADGKPLTVTLDQAWTNNPTVEAEGRIVSNGGFTYYNLDASGKTDLVAEYSERIGSWNRNAREMTNAEVRGDVFTAYLPIDGVSSYAYGVTLRGEALHAEILCNTGDCQAVRMQNGNGEKVVMAAFYRDTDITAGGVTLRGKAGASLIAKQ